MQKDADIASASFCRPKKSGCFDRKRFGFVSFETLASRRSRRFQAYVKNAPLFVSFCKILTEKMRFFSEKL
jgi:hypothetical protein